MNNFENQNTLKMNSSSSSSNLLPECLEDDSYSVRDFHMTEVENNVNCNSVLPAEQRSTEKEQINFADSRNWSPYDMCNLAAENQNHCQQTNTDEMIQQKHEAANQQGQHCVPEPSVLTNEATNSTTRNCRALTSAQQLVLEKEFASAKYLSQQKRRELSQKLGLPETTIRVWVQSKRAKLKKAEELKDIRSASTINTFLDGLFST